MAKLSVKATYRTTTRRFPTNDTVTFADFNAELKALFTITEPFVITYEDSDSDVITISSDIELEELFAAKCSPTPVARLHLLTPHEANLDPPVARSLSTPLSPSSTADVAHLDTLLSGVAELLTAIKGSDLNAVDTPNPAASDPAIAERSSTRDSGSSRDAVVTAAAPGASPPRKRLLYGLWSLIPMFPTGKCGFKKSLKAVSPKAKVALKKLVRYISKSENCWRIVGALGAAFPVLSKWIAEELGDEGLPDVGKVDCLVAAGEAILLPRAGDEATRRVTAFVRVTLADQVVVNILRELAGIGAVLWETGVKAALGNRSETPSGVVPEDGDAQESDTQEQGLTSEVLKTDSTQPAPLPRKGIFSGLRPHMPAFSSAKGAFRKDLKSVSPECSSALNDLIRYTSKADNRSEIARALKEVSPIFRQWIADELVDEGLPEVQKIDSLVSDVEESLSPKAGEEATKRVTDFMRVALADEGMITFLRKERRTGEMPWEKGFKGALPKLRKSTLGFHVHTGTTCTV